MFIDILKKKPAAGCSRISAVLARVPSGGLPNMGIKACENAVSSLPQLARVMGFVCFSDAFLAGC